MTGFLFKGMEKKIENDISILATSVLTEAPTIVECGRERFYINHPSLGVMQMSAPIIERLGIDKKNFAAAPTIEALRVVRDNKTDALRIIAFYGFCERKSITNPYLVEKRLKTLENALKDEDIATLLIVVLNAMANIEVISKETGINKELNRLQRVNAAKKNKSTFTFGGVTTWGSLCDAACERYGWTLDYVLWGISYANLVLMLRDKVTSVYLTDEERKRVHISNDRTTYDGNDPNALKAAFSRLGLK